MTDKDDECELGYWSGQPFGGKGLIPEAAKELLRHAFEDLKMNVVWCGYYAGNMQSKRVQEKCGFKPYRSLIMETRMGTKEHGTLNILTNPNKNIRFEFSHPETLIYKED